MHMIFKAKATDKIYNSLGKNTSSSQICTTAEPSKAMFLMRLKSNRELEVQQKRGWIL